jgi:hypothetical protein
MATGNGRRKKAIGDGNWKGLLFCYLCHLGVCCVAIAEMLQDCLGNVMNKNSCNELC